MKEKRATAATIGTSQARGARTQLGGLGEGNAEVLGHRLADREQGDRLGQRDALASRADEGHEQVGPPGGQIHRVPTVGVAGQADHDPRPVGIAGDHPERRKGLSLGVEQHARDGGTALVRGLGADGLQQQETERNEHHAL